MRKAVFSILLVFASLYLVAQPTLKIAKESHDFGTITEGTQASYTFDIQNTGTQPLIISNVQPSCGCTTPEWTKDPIPPRGKGKIMATYNSQGRPGAFNKAITVTSNDVESSRVLTIKGFVGPKAEAKTYTAEELKNSPIVSMERTLFNFGKVEVGQNIHQKVKLTNKGKSNLKFSGIQVGCYCVNYTIPKQEIAPEESVELDLTYTPKNQGDQTDIVTLSTNDIVTTKPTITLQAKVVQSLTNGGIMNQGGGAIPFK